jgi:large subunit ribosomal protein L29
MKMKDLRGLSMPDLQKKLKDSRQELFNLRFQMATGQLQNHRQIRHVRRNLAQILTEIHLKEQDGDEPQAVAAVEPAAPEPKRKARGRRASAGAEATEEQA